MREKTIEQNLATATKRRGGLAPKLTSPGTQGMPDRLILLPGGHLGFVETKAPRGKPRPIQARQHQKLRQLGYQVHILDNTTDTEKILDAIQTTPLPTTHD